MRILVTGAAGFIGSSVCNKLSQAGHEVIATDSLSSYYSVELKQLRIAEFLVPFKIPLLSGDLANPEFVTTLFDSWQPETVLHLAAQAGVRIPKENQNVYVQSNLVGFANILRESSMHSVDSFLYASSSSVYGDQTEQSSFNEFQNKLKPNSFYGTTKLSNEIFAEQESMNSGMKTRGLRFFTAYGPWGRPDMAYFRMISSALNGKPFHLYGDGSVKRDLTYIDDIVFSVVALINELQSNERGFSDVVNVGGGNPVSMAELIECVSEIADSKLAVEFGAPNPLDSRLTWSSSEYLKSLVGARTFTKIDRGIFETYQWAKQTEIRSKLDKWIKSVD
jgi:UDP-glucuronate 4-epimerase